MFDKMLEFVINSVRAEEAQKQKTKDEAAEPTKPLSPAQFYVHKKAGDLVENCKRKGTHYREREKEFTKKLEESEKELREKGVTMDAYNTSTGTYQQFQNTQTLASGSIQGPQVTFQPRIDQRLMDNVKNSKDKMLEYRDKAAQYEKYARAFACDRERLLRLTTEDITYFGLEG